MQLRSPEIHINMFNKMNWNNLGIIVGRNDFPGLPYVKGTNFVVVWISVRVTLLEGIVVR